MGISVILDASQQVIVSADTTLDLTNTILTRLKGTPPAAKKPGN